MNSSDMKMLPKPSFNPLSSGINTEYSNQNIPQSEYNGPTPTRMRLAPYALELRPEDPGVIATDHKDVTNYENQGYVRANDFDDINPTKKDGRRKSYGGSRRRRPSRKYKKSKRVFRKKSRSTRRR